MVQGRRVASTGTFAPVGAALLVSGRLLAGVVLAVVSLLLIYAAHRAGRGHDGLP